ncbi:hypothetical protein C8J57DRAFT_1239998 [Mycena rebaudengoi]|nr:hypothetical protein C8J57DRAFT_1239998 [Mycena rebaudengoi]
MAIDTSLLNNYENYTDGIHPISEKVLDDEDLDLKAIVESLLDVVRDTAHPVPAPADHSALDVAVDFEVNSWNVDDGNQGRTFKSISKKAISVVEVGIRFVTFWGRSEEKFASTMYVWFFFYIDDLAAQPFLKEFQRKIMLGLPQEHGPLAQFQKALGNLYKYWDPVNANSMVCAALEFVSATILEDRKEIAQMAVQPSASNWPRYMRTKSGMAAGFSCAAFPISAHPDISAYIQALPDMDDFFCYANDILSFYKEELAGETMNYVHIRAKTTQKHPKRVLLEMIREVGDVHQRLQATLAGQPDALMAWKTFEYGFIARHLALERYQLRQLGIMYTAE